MTRLSRTLANNLEREIHAISTMLLCRMAIKVIKRLRFSWHTKKHVKTTTYCALQVRFSLVKNSLYPLAMQATLTLTRTSALSVRKEGNLFMQATLRKKTTDKNKAKQMGRNNKL